MGKLQWESCSGKVTPCNVMPSKEDKHLEPTTSTALKLMLFCFLKERGDACWYGINETTVLEKGVEIYMSTLIN